MVSPKYHAAFAWALLASTVNMKLFPPKFYSKNQIKCITTVTSQQVNSPIFVPLDLTLGYFNKILNRKKFSFKYSSQK